MILKLYATRNKKSGQYGKIAAEILDPKEIVESYSCSFMEAPADQKVYLKELEVYQLGEYDTLTGKIVALVPEFLLDLGTIDGTGKGTEVKE